MIGAPHAGGSITSNGGDSSPSGSVIVRRRPFEAACRRLCQKKADLMKPHCRQSQLLCQAKRHRWRQGGELTKGGPLLITRELRSNTASLRRCRAARAFTRNL